MSYKLNPIPSLEHLKGLVLKKMELEAMLAQIDTVINLAPVQEQQEAIQDLAAKGRIVPVNSGENK